MRHHGYGTNASWYMLNTQKAELRPLSQRGGGPSIRRHISVARVSSGSAPLVVTILDTEAEGALSLHAEHDRFGTILAANLLENWAREHPASVAAEGLPGERHAGLLTTFDSTGTVVRARHRLEYEVSPRTGDVSVRFAADDPAKPRPDIGRWWVELRYGGHHVLIDQWARSPGGPGAMLGHTLERLTLLAGQLPDWPPFTVVGPAPTEQDEWYVFSKSTLRTNRISIPQRNPYRNSSLLLLRRLSGPTQFVAVDPTHAWFDPHEVSVDTGLAVRGASAQAIVTAVSDRAAGHALLAVLGENEMLISVIDVRPTGRAAGSAPGFRGDLTLQLSPGATWRDGVPVLVLPFRENTYGGHTLPGQAGVITWRGDSEEGTAVLVAVAHPNGSRYVIEYLVRTGGGELLHDILLPLNHLTERNGLHETAIGFDFTSVPVLELQRPTAGQRSSDPRAEPDFAASTDEVGGLSLGCQLRTFDRARAIFPPAPVDAVEPRAERLHALDEFIQSVMRDPDEHSRISRLLRSHGLSADEVIDSRNGRLAISLVVAELCIEARFPVLSGSPGPRETADLERLRELLFTDAPPTAVFADALTSFLRAQATDHSQTRARAVSRILNLVTEWLVGAQQRPHIAHTSLDARAFGGRELGDLWLFLDQMPWLAWFVTNRVGPRRFRIRLDDVEFLEVLGLTRPRTRYVAPTASASTNPGNFRSVSGQLDLSDLLDRYVIDEKIVERLVEEPRLLDDLARACEVMYHLPWQARRAIQSLTELGPLAELLDSVVSRGAELRMGSLEDIAVVVDAPGGGRPPRICVVNANGTRRCRVIIGDESRVSLAEFAASVPDAAQYMTAPFTLDRDARAALVRDADTSRSVEFDERTRLDAGSGADSEWVDPLLFRGRHEQLNQILGTLHPGATVRVPVAVYGPRGAGKTTLAVHACRQGVQRGWLSGFAKVDLFVDPIDAEGEEYLQSLTRVLVEKATHELGLTLAGSPADPAAALDEIDRAAAGRPMGIILDEFDRLLSHTADSPLQRLAIRLGGKRWQNLTVIATIQRFYKNTAELETWQLIGCPADLSWRDGITYFAQPLLEVEEGARTVGELRAPVVLPIGFRDRVHRRLGLRPYFWGRLRRRLESELLMSSGYAVVELEAIDRIIDEFIDENQYLGQPLQESEGVSTSEARRRDLFTLPEKRILASFAVSGRKRVSMDEAIRVGSAHAVHELQERAYVVVQGGLLQLAVPLFGEYLRAHALDFEEFLVPPS